MIAVILALHIFMQVAPAPQITVPAPPPNPSTVVDQGQSLTPPSPQVQTRTQTQGFSKADVQSAAIAMAEAQSGEVAKGGFKAIDQALGIPDWIMRRDRKYTVDQDQIVQLTESMRFTMVLLIPAALAAVLMVNALSVVTGNLSIAQGGIAGIGVVTFAAGLAWNSRMLMGAAIDLANFVFGRVAGATVRAFVQPGLTLNSFGSAVVEGLIAIAFCVAVLILIVKLLMQFAWVSMLTPAAPVALLASVVPGVKGWGHQWIREWSGSLFDPFLVLIALKLGAPIMSTMDAAPDLVQSLLRLAIVLCSLRAPGFFRGASTPGMPIAEAIMINRMLNRGQRSVSSGRAAIAVAPAAATTPAHAMSSPGSANSATFKSQNWTPGNPAGPGSRSGRSPAGSKRP